MCHCLYRGFIFLVRSVARSVVPGVRSVINPVRMSSFHIDPLERRQWIANIRQTPVWKSSKPMSALEKRPETVEVETKSDSESVRSVASVGCRSSVVGWAIGWAANVLSFADALIRKTTSTLTDRIAWIATKTGFSPKQLSSFYLRRVATSIGLMFVSAYLNALSSVVAGYRNPNIVITSPAWAADKPNLPDLGHDLIAAIIRPITGQEFISSSHIPDQFVLGMGFPTILFILIHPLRFLIIRRTFIAFTFLNLLRSCTILMTSFPDSSPNCIAQFSDHTGAYKNNTFSVAFRKGIYRAVLVIVEPGVHITCGDMVYSGHGMLTTLAFLIFNHYCRSSFYESSRNGQNRNRWIRRFVFLVWLSASFSIIGTKLHYTVDLFLAIIITGSVFAFYHHVVECEQLKNRSGFIRWMESDEVLAIDRLAFVGDPVPDETVPGETVPGEATTDETVPDETTPKKDHL